MQILGCAAFGTHIGGDGGFKIFESHGVENWLGKKRTAESLLPILDVSMSEGSLLMRALRSRVNSRPVYVMVMYKVIGYAEARMLYAGAMLCFEDLKGSYPSVKSIVLELKGILEQAEQFCSGKEIEFKKPSSLESVQRSDIEDIRISGTTTVALQNNGKFIANKKLPTTFVALCGKWNFREIWGVSSLETANEIWHRSAISYFEFDYKFKFVSGVPEGVAIDIVAATAQTVSDTPDSSEKDDVFGYRSQEILVVKESLRSSLWPFGRNERRKSLARINSIVFDLEDYSSKSSKAKKYLRSARRWNVLTLACLFVLHCKKIDISTMIPPADDNDLKRYLFNTEEFNIAGNVWLSSSGIEVENQKILMNSFYGKVFGNVFRGRAEDFYQWINSEMVQL